MLLSNMTYALYARTSTDLQSKGLETQILALKGYCLQNNISDYVVFKDEAISGTKTSRPQLDRMLKGVEEGLFETVLVFSFSRFARSTRHLLEVLDYFQSKKVAFISITEKIDTHTPLGKAFYTIVSALGQLEREILVERVCAGLQNARSKGIRLGRPPTINSKAILELRALGSSYRTIQRITGHSISTVSRVLRGSVR